MGLKPIDKRSPLGTREAIWAAIRRLRVFTATDLWGETNCSKDTIREYLTGLRAAGIVEYYHDTEKGATVHRLARDGGVEAPRVRRDGSEVTSGRGRENMWRTMRVLKEFSARDLAVQASTDDVQIAELEAKSYIHYLHKAGYLAITVESKPGSATTPGRVARYRFVASRYTGPKPPQVQRVKQVYDPNQRKVVWKGGSDDAE